MDIWTLYTATRLSHNENFISTIEMIHDIIHSVFPEVFSASLSVCLYISLLLFPFHQTDLYVPREVYILLILTLPLLPLYLFV